MLQQLEQVHNSTDLNQVDHCLTCSPPHLNICRREFLPGLLRAWFLGKRQSFAQRNRCMEGGALTEHPLSQETGQFVLPRSTRWVEVRNELTRREGVDWPVHREPSWSEPHCSHYISGVHQQLLLILEDGELVRLQFAALVHGTLTPHVPGHFRVRVAWMDRVKSVGR